MEHDFKERFHIEMLAIMALNKYKKVGDYNDDWDVIMRNLDDKLKNVSIKIYHNLN